MPPLSLCVCVNAHSTQNWGCEDDGFVLPLLKDCYIYFFFNCPHDVVVQVVNLAFWYEVEAQIHRQYKHVYSRSLTRKNIESALGCACTRILWAIRINSVKRQVGRAGALTDVTSSHPRARFETRHTIKPSVLRHTW